MAYGSDGFGRYIYGLPSIINRKDHYVSHNNLGMIDKLSFTIVEMKEQWLKGPGIYYSADFVNVHDRLLMRMVLENLTRER